MLQVPVLQAETVFVRHCVVWGFVGLRDFRECEVGKPCLCVSVDSLHKIGINEKKKRRDCCVVAFASLFEFAF